MTTRDVFKMRKHEVRDPTESESLCKEEFDDSEYDEDEGDGDTVSGPKRKSGASVKPGQRQSFGAASLAALAAAYVNARNSVTLRALYSKAEIDESNNNDSDDDSDDDVSKEGDDSELTPSFVKNTATSKLIARESYAVATPREKAQRLLASSTDQFSAPIKEERVEKEKTKLETVQEPTGDSMVLDAEKKKRKSSRLSKQTVDEKGVNINIVPLIIGIVVSALIVLVLYPWGVEESTADSAAGGLFDWHHGFLGYGRQREL